MNRGFGMTGGT